MARRLESKSVPVDLKTVDARDRYKPRPTKEPYWQPLSAGRYLGFRPSTAGGAGTWLARYYDADTSKKPSRTLGDFGHLPPSKRFDAAKKEAEAWFQHLSRGGSEDDATVKDACESYAAENPDAAKRFPRYVYDDPIARIKLQKLREHHVKEWRARLEAMPAVVSRSKGGEPTTRRRAAASSATPERMASCAPLIRPATWLRSMWKPGESATCPC